VQYPVGTVEELRRERCRLVELEGHRIGVISVDDAFFAVRNRCPHRPADICEGTVGGTLVGSSPQELRYGRHQRVLRCPWHGWEFDLETGRSLLEPERFGLRVYPVTVEDGTVFVST
jgi:nitrite reductase (NADH) small subunit